MRTMLALIAAAALIGCSSTSSSSNVSNTKMQPASEAGYTQDQIQFKEKEIEKIKLDLARIDRDKKKLSPNDPQQARQIQELRKQEVKLGDDLIAAQDELAEMKRHAASSQPVTANANQPKTNQPKSGTGADDLERLLQEGENILASYKANTDISPASRYDPNRTFEERWADEILLLKEFCEKMKKARDATEGVY